MANFVTKHTVSFSSSTTSDTLEIDPRDVPVSVLIPSGFSGTTLEVEFSFDDGTSFKKIEDEGGTQVGKFSGITADRAISLTKKDWDNTNIMRFVSSASETASLTVITKTRV